MAQQSYFLLKTMSPLSIKKALSGLTTIRISKKILPKAHDRNRVRRRIRALLPESGVYDILVRSDIRSLTPTQLAQVINTHV